MEGFAELPCAQRRLQLEETLSYGLNGPFHLPLYPNATPVLPVNSVGQPGTRNRF